MGSAPFTCSVATKEEAVELLKKAEQIDLYYEECTDSWSNFMARKDHAYRPATVKNIEEYTKAFNALISKVPKQLQDIGDIKIISLMGSADAGMPHTRPPNIICYPHLNLSVSTFIHELCHVHQRKFPKVWNAIFHSLNWEQWDGSLPSHIESYRRYNPDTIDIPLWHLHDWVPIPVFRDISNPVLNECDMWFYHIHDGYHVKKIPDAIAVELLPSSAYEHPREMTAYIISEPDKYRGTPQYKTIRHYIDI